MLTISMWTQCSNGMLSALTYARVAVLALCVTTSTQCVSYSQSTSSMPAVSTSRDSQDFTDAMRAVDSGDEATAKPLLEKLKRRDPHIFFVNESLGLIYAGEGKVDAALPLLSAAAKERPTSEVARANL